jgi:alpha-ribazole phosphatase
MEIYLIRHTTPLVDKGICYGWADLDVTETFLQEAAFIKPHLPATIQNIYCSPLQRCNKLANELFPDKNIVFNDDLKELNCGTWEMQKWDAIAKHEIDPWMNDFVNVKVPQGESYLDLYHRVNAVFKNIVLQKQSAAIVAHGGVLRSILSYITQTPLINSFDTFKINYGCVVKISVAGENFNHTICYNMEAAKETHKPSRFS